MYKEMTVRSLSFKHLAITTLHTKVPFPKATIQQLKSIDKGNKRHLVAHAVDPLAGEVGVCALAEVDIGDTIDAVQHKDARALEEGALLLRGAHVPQPAVAARSQHLNYVTPPLHLPARKLSA